MSLEKKKETQLPQSPSERVWDGLAKCLNCGMVFKVNSSTNDWGTIEIAGSRCPGCRSNAYKNVYEEDLPYGGTQ